MPLDVQFERALLEFLAEETTVCVMLAASDSGRPAIEAIGDDLLREFGDRVLATTVKQHIGRLVRRVMDSRGYEPHMRRRPAKSTLFTRGTVYRPDPEPVVAVLARYGIRVAPAAILHEVRAAASSAVGDPPYVARGQIDWSCLAAGPVPHRLQEHRSAFAAALDRELCEQEQRREAALPSSQPTAQQLRHLPFDDRHAEQGNGQLIPRIQTALRVGALYATGLTLPETAERLRIDERNVADMVKKRSLYSMPAMTHTVRLPLFQFDIHGLVPKVERVLPELDATIHPVGVFNWFTNPNPDLALEQTSFKPTSPRDWLLGHHALGPVRQAAAAVTVGGLSVVPGCVER